MCTWGFQLKILAAQRRCMCKVLPRQFGTFWFHPVSGHGRHQVFKRLHTPLPSLSLCQKENSWPSVKGWSSRNEWYVRHIPPKNWPAGGMHSKCLVRDDMTSANYHTFNQWHQISQAIKLHRIYDLVVKLMSSSRWSLSIKRRYGGCKVNT